MIIDFFKQKLRTGEAYQKLRRELNATEKYTTVELEALQTEKLRQVVNISYQYVPYYRDVFKRLKLTPNDMRNVIDLSKLPTIDKNIVKSQFKQFRSNICLGPVFDGLTSGTSGSPSNYLRDLQSINHERAALCRQWDWAGKALNSRRAVLRGDVVCDISQKKPPFWRIDRFAKALILSSYHLNDTNIPHYLQKINEFKPFDLYAYPATAYVLAQYCIRNRIKQKFMAVFTSSEQLYAYQREIIEKAFGCVVFDWYGQAERVAAIGNCKNSAYHIFDDYSIVELLPCNNGMLEIVGTTISNSVMPLIRYRTGDFVDKVDISNCECGMKFRKVGMISGREITFLKSSDNCYVGAASLSHVPRGVENLIEMQFVQKSSREIIMNVVVENKFSEADEARLIKNAKSHISNEMVYVINKVDHIERSSTGKFIPVIPLAKKHNGDMI